MNREEVLEIVRGCSSPVAAINTLIAKRRCHAILETAKIIDRLNKENNIFTGRRRWTEEEENFLIEKYTITNMDSLCKILQRTEKAIILRAEKLDLDKHTGYITCKKLSIATGVDYKALINNKELIKVKRQYNSGTLAAYVREDIFWTWARKNIEKIDTKKLEKNLVHFINVPTWFKRLNKKSKVPKKYQFWTRAEIETLIFLRENCNYTYKEIAKRMDRSVRALEFKYWSIQQEKARREKLKVS
jgi:hypothetical protein